MVLTANGSLHCVGGHVLQLHLNQIHPSPLSV
jgi:hypothetical protein